MIISGIQKSSVGEYLTAMILEPEWVQWSVMVYELMEILFTAYVDYPIIRAKAPTAEVPAAPDML